MARNILARGREQRLFNSDVLRRAYNKTKTDPMQNCNARQLDASRLLDASFRYEAHALQYGPEPPVVSSDDRWQGESGGDVSSAADDLQVAQLEHATDHNYALEYDPLSGINPASLPLSTPSTAAMPANDSHTPPSRPAPSPRDLLADIDMALLATPFKSANDTAERLDALHARLRAARPLPELGTRAFEANPAADRAAGTATFNDDNSANVSQNYEYSPAGDVSLFHYSPLRPPMRFSAVWHGPESAAVDGGGGHAPEDAAAANQAPAAPAVFNSASPAKSDVSFAYALSAFADA